VNIVHILPNMQIMHIWDCDAAARFVSSGFEDRIAIFRADAWNYLTDAELEEILSCGNILVLASYVDGVFKSAVRLWKFIMPRGAKDIFQNEVFYPASVDPNLQKHLGMTAGQRIFDL
jgi:hypothetical protein